MIKLCRCKVASYCYDLFEESEAYMRVLREIEKEIYIVFVIFFLFFLIHFIENIINLFLFR